MSNERKYSQNAGLSRILWGCTSTEKLTKKCSMLYCYASALCTIVDNAIMLN